MAVAAATLVPAITGWAVLAIDSVRLAIPQRDVRHVDLSADLKVLAVDESAEVGWLLREDDVSWPAYGLDPQLALQHSPPSGRRMCVFFGMDGAVRGILCNHVWSLAADKDLAPELLAGCHRGRRSPVLALARFEKGVALVSSGAALSAYLLDLMEAGHGRTG